MESYDDDIGRGVSNIRPKPRFQARMAGVLYVLEGATSVFGQLWVSGKIFVSGDTTGS